MAWARSRCAPHQVFCDKQIKVGTNLLACSLSCAAQQMLTWL
jgi:hypothetical protein